MLKSLMKYKDILTKGHWSKRNCNNIIIELRISKDFRPSPKIKNNIMRLQEI